MKRDFETCAILIPDEQSRLKLSKSATWPPEDKFILDKRRQTSAIQYNRFSLEKQNKQKTLLETVRANYKPIHKELIDEQLSTEQLIDILISPKIGEELKSPDFHISRLQIEEPTPGVFLIPEFFSESGIAKLLEEIKNYLTADLPLERPNANIPYGLKLNSTGLFNSLLANLQKVRYFC
jgi:hypothetical protein